MQIYKCGSQIYEIIFTGIILKMYIFREWLLRVKLFIVSIFLLKSTFSELNDLEMMWLRDEILYVVNTSFLGGKKSFFHLSIFTFGFFFFFDKMDVFPFFVPRLSAVVMKRNYHQLEQAVFF